MDNALRNCADHDQVRLCAPIAQGRVGNSSDFAKTRACVECDGTGIAGRHEQFQLTYALHLCGIRDTVDKCGCSAAALRTGLNKEGAQIGAVLCLDAGLGDQASYADKGRPVNTPKL